MGDTEIVEPLVRKLATRAPLTTADRAAILALPHRVKTARKDAYLTREGVRSDHCFLLLSGLVYEQKWTGSGAKQILALHLPGDLAGISTAFLPGSDHDLRALGALTYAEIPREALAEAVRHHPSIAMAMWLQAMVETSIAREWIVNVGRRYARQRIAHLLCELAYRAEANGLHPAAAFECPLTQDHIADSIGTTPVHVNRTLKAMRIEGVVGSTRQALTIPDIDALRKIGEFNPAYLYLPRGQG